jgi:hypothetical protein
VHAEHDLAVARAFVEMVDAERSSVSVRDLGVVGCEGKAGQIPESFIGGPKGFHVPYYDSIGLSRFALSGCRKKPRLMPTLTVPESGV